MTPTPIRPAWLDRWTDAELRAEIVRLALRPALRAGSVAFRLEQLAGELESRRWMRRAA